MINNHVNKIILVGCVETPRLSLQRNSKGSQVTDFEVRTHLQVRTVSGYVVEESYLHPVTAWGDLARLCAKNLRKGNLVYLEGRLCWGHEAKRKGLLEIPNSKTLSHSPNPWIIAEQIRLLSGEEGSEEVQVITSNAAQNSDAQGLADDSPDGENERDDVSIESGLLAEIDAYQTLKGDKAKRTMLFSKLPSTTSVPTRGNSTP